MNLQYEVVIRVQLETNISRQLGGLGVFSPGEHNLGAVLAHCVVSAVPGQALPLLHRFLAPTEDHVVRSVASGDGLEFSGPDLARSQVSDGHPGADIIVCLGGSHA